MLFETLQKDLITAMKARDQETVATVRFLLAAIKKFEIDAYPPTSDKKLTEEDVVKILQKQVKTHKESIEAFKKGGRNDLVSKEEKELAILEKYLPAQMTDAEITQIVEKVKQQGVSNFGQAMGAVMKEVAGRADGGRVSGIVKKILG